MSLPDRVPARPALPDCDTARAIRERAGWSQKRLADAIGVAEQTILRWEFGRTAPFGPNLARYADILDRLTREHGDVAPLTAVSSSDREARR